MTIRTFKMPLRSTDRKGSALPEKRARPTLHLGMARDEDRVEPPHEGSGKSLWPAH